MSKNAYNHPECSKSGTSGGPGGRVAWLPGLPALTAMLRVIWDAVGSSLTGFCPIEGFIPRLSAIITSSACGYPPISSAIELPQQRIYFH